MTSQPVVLAGASGKLGTAIAASLSERGAPFRALTRADFADDATLRRAVASASCVVSALAGHRDVIVDLQTRLLDAAVAGGVPRFIPSDFSLDFTKIPPGSNRNLGWREEFRLRLDRAGIRPTSILNGAFMELLTGDAPFILSKIKRVLCWGDPAQTMDFTTVPDVAKFTAAAALDDDAPRFLRIAGDQISAEGLAAAVSDVTGERYKVFRPGSLATFGRVIAFTKWIAPGAGELYPSWQGMQYMHNMYSGVAKFPAVDNARYPGHSFTTVREYLGFQGKSS